MIFGYARRGGFSEVEALVESYALAIKERAALNGAAGKTGAKNSGVGEAMALVELFATWRAALESQEIRKSMAPQMGRPDKEASPAKKARRI